MAAASAAARISIDFPAAALLPLQTRSLTVVDRAACAAALGERGYKTDTKNPGAFAPGLFRSDRSG